MVLVATQVKRRRGTTAENDAFTGAEGEITVDTEKHQLRVHDGETQGGFVIGSGGSGRNIGDIFYTKRTDTGLAGAVECNGGTYNTEDYTGAGSIGELLAGGKLDYISLTDYATAISTKGWCDKIGWDGGTTVRVPTLTPHIIQKNNIPVYAGELNPINSSETTTTWRIATTATVPISGRRLGTQDSGGTMLDSAGVGGTYSNNLTISNLHADTTDTAQLRVMFQLFNSTTDEAVATVGTVVAQVGENTTQIANRVVKGHELIDFQIPTAANGYTWYRKYADGWVEQGGLDTRENNSVVTITLPVVMSNANYNVTKTNQGNSSATSVSLRSYAVQNKTTTSFQTLALSESTGGFMWQVSGMAA